MKNFTLYDPEKDRMKKTKRCIGLLTFCMVILGFSQISYAQQSCEVSVTVSSTGMGNNTQWELLNSYDQVVLSGGPYNSNYSDTQTYTAINPPYSLRFLITGASCTNTPA